MGSEMCIRDRLGSGAFFEVVSVVAGFPTISCSPNSVQCGFLYALLLL